MSRELEMQRTGRLWKSEDNTDLNPPGRKLIKGQVKIIITKYRERKMAGGFKQNTTHTVRIINIQNKTRRNSP